MYCHKLHINEYNELYVNYLRYMTSKNLCNFTISVKVAANTFNWQHFSLIVIVQTNSSTAWHLYGPMFEACVYWFINIFETTNLISKISVNRLCSSTIEHQTLKTKDCELNRFLSTASILAQRMRLHIPVAMFQQSTVPLCGTVSSDWDCTRLLCFVSTAICSFVRIKVTEANVQNDNLD